LLCRFADRELERLEREAGFAAGFSRELVRAFRMKMQLIRGAPDERDFRAMKSLHFEKLKGKRQHQHSMRLNDQWRLILELERTEDGKVVVVIRIEDYH
jgi:toxin HigB-1